MSEPAKEEDRASVPAARVSTAPLPSLAPEGPLWSTLFRLPRAIGWRDHVIGFALAAAYVAWLLATSRSLGFPRDESFYFQAGTQYAHWFDLLFTKPKMALEQGAIDGPWSTNHEHPSLMKSLFGLSWLFLHEKWHWDIMASTAFRLPGMAISALSLWVTYLFGARAYSRRAGAIAALSLGLIPQVFFHAHLACFDMPIMTMWLLSVYVYWRSEKVGGLAWAVAAGVVYGLTLETKHNAWILPAVFVPHALFVYGSALNRSAQGLRSQIRGTLVAMAIIGPLVFYALWPWLWHDTKARLQEYVSFHVNHEYYNVEYLGKNYFGPPSPPSYAPMLILASVPTITLVLFALGVGDRLALHWTRIRRFVRRLRRKKTQKGPDATEVSLREPGDTSETDLLLLLAFAAPLAVFFLPKTPIFSGTKHWLPAYPFLAIVAGRGFEVVADAMQRALRSWKELPRKIAPWALAATCVVGPLVMTANSHPFGISAYVPLVGGFAGGADLGLNRQYWGYTSQNVGSFLAQAAPPNSSVFIHDTTGDAWYRMQEEGRVRRDLRPVGNPGEGNFSMVHHELHMNGIDYELWIAFGTTSPVFVLTHDGVPFVSVYRRP
jgi:4-amino-4-deoxy-L-arabinose transferase-like glycosyltransferase